MNIWKSLALFDVDDTLVHGEHGHVKAYCDAIYSVFNVTVKVDVKTIKGYTDQQVIKKICMDYGLNVEEAISKMNLIMDEMVKSFRESLPYSKIKSIPNVNDLLDEFYNQQTLLGLVTGNLQEIAMLKLEKVGLKDYFKVGGFGSDAESRPKLVRIAIKRAEDNFNFKSDSNVFLFDDAPRGIQAAKEADVIVVGMATGIYTVKDLKESNPNYVFSSFSNYREIADILMKNLKTA